MINLNEFVGKAVTIQIEDGRNIDGYISFEEGNYPYRFTSYDWKVADYVQISFDGKLTNEIYIKEIYGEGAYSINTKQIFDPTNAEYQLYLKLKSKFEKA